MHDGLHARSHSRRACIQPHSRDVAYPHSICSCGMLGCMPEARHSRKRIQPYIHVAAWALECQPPPSMLSFMPEASGSRRCIFTQCSMGLFGVTTLVDDAALGAVLHLGVHVLASSCSGVGSLSVAALCCMKIAHYAGLHRLCSQGQRPLGNDDRFDG